MILYHLSASRDFMIGGDDQRVRERTAAIIENALNLQECVYSSRISNEHIRTP